MLRSISLYSARVFCFASWLIDISRVSIFTSLQHQHSLSSSGWQVEGGMHCGQCSHKATCLLRERCTTRLKMHLVVLYDTRVHLPAFYALKAVMVLSTSLTSFSPPSAGFILPHTSSVVFSKAALSFARISPVVVAASVS